SGTKLARGGRLLLALDDLAAPPDHLGERPVRHPLAVREATAAVPEHLRGEAVDVLLEFPGEPRLADARQTDDGDETRPTLVGGRVKQLLDLAQLTVAADERSLHPGPAKGASDRGHHAVRAPELHRRSLALELALPRVLVRDRRLRRSPGRLVDEDGPGCGGRL